MNKKIFLINAGNDRKYGNVVHGASFPPLGVVSLATYIKKMAPRWSVRILDGVVTDENEISEELHREKPGVVGISVLSTSYQTALKLARIAKEFNAITIFGNDQAACTGRNMLAARREIDYICTADAGEKPLVHFLEYLEGRRGIADVAKLMYRADDGTLRHNSHLPELDPGRFVLDQIPVPDRSLLSDSVRRVYQKNYAATHPNEDVTGTATINRIRGCARAKARCMYCGIADLTIRISSPEMFWDDVRNARETGAGRLMEASDSFSCMPGYLEQLADAKPRNLDFRAFVYTSAKEVNRRLVEVYKRLGIFRANMGLDSGDKDILRRLKGSRDSVEQNKESAMLLAEAGIRIYASFVIGGPGETRESLESTGRFIRWLIDGNLADGVEVQPLFPGLNTRAGSLLTSPALAARYAELEGFKLGNIDLLHHMPEKWCGHENPDPEEVSRDWAAIFSEVPYDDLLRFSDALQGYSQERGVPAGSSWTAR
jgi:radical SAM superfamily enzyme YgiQ (UPF0313 family)